MESGSGPLFEPLHYPIHPCHLPYFLNHLLTKLLRRQDLYCCTPASDPRLDLLRATNHHREETRTIWQVLDTLAMVPGALLDTSHNRRRKAERHFNLTFVAPDHSPRGCQETLRIEALWYCKRLIGQPRFIDTFDLEGAYGVAHLIVANSITCVADSRRLNEVGSKGTLGRLVLRIRAITQTHFFPFCPALCQDLQCLHILPAGVPGTYCRRSLLDVPGDERRFRFKGIGQFL